MSQHSSRANLAAIYYTCGHIGPRHETSHILPLFTTLWAHWTTSQHRSRANLAAIYYTLGTLDHVTTELKRQSWCYLLHFGHIGPCHNTAQRPRIAQESTGEDRRAQESLGEPRRAQETEN
eukprot:2746956-Karenia_brevis.AAC.1